MGWNGLSYAEKGGIISCLIPISIIIATFLFLKIICIGGNNECGGYMLPIVVFGPTIFIYPIIAPGLHVMVKFITDILNIDKYYFSVEKIIIIIIALLFYFLIGALIGFIYGKIKSR